jgi:hypothetical protein
MHQETVRVLTQILFPAVLKLLKKLQPAFGDSFQGAVENAAGNGGSLAESFGGAVSADWVKASSDEQVVSLTAARQFMVENLGGFNSFLGSSDVARIDAAVLESWRQLAEEKIREVEIEETRTGKRLRCKFKPIKDAKYEGKGVVQLSEKAQLLLDTHKGSLVVVKPVIEA